MILATMLASGVSYLIWGKYGVQQLAVQELERDFEHPVLFVLMAITVTTIVPFVEELLFRGFMQNWLRKYIGRGRAIFLTAFIFACFHYSHGQGIGNFELIISLFSLSLFLGYIYERQQTLWASIGLHSTFNAISVIAIAFSKSFPGIN